MSDELKARVAAKVLGLKPPEQAGISAVEQQSKDMGVIDETLETARRLAGTNALQEELRRKDADIKQGAEEKEKVTKELEQSKSDVVRAELGAKIDSLSESIRQGASRQSIGDEIADLRKAAENLGMGTSKVSELKDLLGLINTMKPNDKNLAQQIKEAKEMLTIIEGDKKPTQAGLPADALLKLEEMKNNLAVQLETMKDDRQRRDQEFQIRMKQFEIDNLLRRSEVEGKVAVERERNQMFGDLIEGIGGTITKATMENANTPITSSSPQTIEAIEGQFGEIECPSCKSLISIAADATKAICPGCKTVYPVQRIVAQGEE